QHEKRALAHAGEQPAVMLRRLALIVEQARADRIVGSFDRAETHIETVEDAEIAFGADVKHRLAGLARHMIMGEVAGGDDIVIGFADDTEAIEGLDDSDAWSRRIGDEYHGAAAPAELRQRCPGRRKSRYSVVHDPPHVAQHGIVARREVSKSIDDG